MSDFDSSLPIRTENAGDVISKIADATTPSQQLKVNVDGSVNITDNSGSLTVDGTVELGATTLAALESITVENGAGGSAVNIQDGGNSITVDALDLDIRDLTATDVVSVNLRDATGTAFSGANPLPVTFSVNGAGDEINDYLKSSAVAAAASVNHDYTVTALNTLLLTQIEASGSGKAKIEIQVETGVATGIFTSKFVQFNSTANTNMGIKLNAPLSVAAGVRVRVIRTNLDKAAQDLYSTISGQEV